MDYYPTKHHSSSHYRIFGSALAVVGPQGEGPDNRVALEQPVLQLLQDAGVRWLSTWRCGDLGRLCPEDVLDTPALAFALKAADAGAAAFVQARAGEATHHGSADCCSALDGNAGDTQLLSSPQLPLVRRVLCTLAGGAHELVHG